MVGQSRRPSRSAKAPASVTLLFCTLRDAITAGGPGDQNRQCVMGRTGELGTGAFKNAQEACQLGEVFENNGQGTHAIVAEVVVVQAVSSARAPWCTFNSTQLGQCQNGMRNRPKYMRQSPTERSGTARGRGWGQKQTARGMAA